MLDKVLAIRWQHEPFVILSLKQFDCQLTRLETFQLLPTRHLTKCSIDREGKFPGRSFAEKFFPSFRSVPRTAVPLVVCVEGNYRATVDGTCGTAPKQQSLKTEAIGMMWASGDNSSHDLGLKFFVVDIWRALLAEGEKRFALPFFAFLFFFHLQSTSKVLWEWRTGNQRPDSHNKRRINYHISPPCARLLFFILSQAGSFEINLEARQRSPSWWNKKVSIKSLPSATFSAINGFIKCEGKMSYRLAGFNNQTGCGVDLRFALETWLRHIN